MNHTKGKWMVAIIGKNMHGKEKYQVVADIPYTGTFGGDTETPICNIDQFRTHEEAKANTKLIAAAPELLEALLNLVNAASGDTLENLKIAIVDAKAIIKKSKS